MFAFAVKRVNETRNETFIKRDWNSRNRCSNISRVGQEFSRTFGAEVEEEKRKGKREEKVKRGEGG